jgi:ankyrin repeat protein
LILRILKLGFHLSLTRGEKERKTALHMAAESDFADTAEVLLSFGADVSLRANHDSTALHLAAKNQSCRVLGQILEKIKHVDSNLVNARDAEGRTPLFVCTAAGQRGQGRGATECMAALLNQRAAVDEADDTGDTPLHMAAKGNLTLFPKYF